MGFLVAAFIKVPYLPIDLIDPLRKRVSEPQYKSTYYLPTQEVYLNT